MNLLAGGSPLAREAVAFAILISAVLIGAAMVFALRTRSLPVCGYCGFSSVRRAHSHRHTFDRLARICFLHPYRCEKCLQRFYCFRSRRMRHPRTHAARV